LTLKAISKFQKIFGAHEQEIEFGGGKDVVRGAVPADEAAEFIGGVAGPRHEDTGRGAHGFAEGNVDAVVGDAFLGLEQRRELGPLGGGVKQGQRGEEDRGEGRSDEKLHQGEAGLPPPGRARHYRHSRLKTASRVPSGFRFTSCVRL